MTSNDIINLGNIISTEIRKNNLKNVRLQIPLDEDLFKKFDEDLYYRQGQNNEYIPSEDEINLKFKDLDIIIYKM